MAQKRRKNPVGFTACAGNVKRVDSAPASADALGKRGKILFGIFVSTGNDKVFFCAGHRHIKNPHFLRKVKAAQLGFKCLARNGGKFDSGFPASAGTGEAKPGMKQNSLCVNIKLLSGSAEKNHRKFKTL